MIRKLFLALILLVASTTFVSAQNLQLHYDARHAFHGDFFPRNYFTATFEMFKPDPWGFTYMFVDVDFSQVRGNIGLAYMEVARDIIIGKSPIMAHIEYNGGIAKVATEGFSIPNAYLVGPSYSTHIGSVSLGTYLVYKYNAFEKVSNDIQWTGIWGLNLLSNKVTISGFIDVWTENKIRTHENFERGKKVIFLTEPQFWYNLTSHLSLGSEIEMSNNFYFGATRAYINPTIAAKWNF